MLTASGIFMTQIYPTFEYSVFRHLDLYCTAFCFASVERQSFGVKSITHVLCELMFYFGRDAVAVASNAEEILLAFIAMDERKAARKFYILILWNSERKANNVRRLSTKARGCLRVCRTKGRTMLNF